MLFAGDTLQLEGGEVVTGPKQYVWDQNKENQSNARLTGLDFNIILPGHSDVLTTNVSNAVKEHINSSEKA
jgi:hypothetical protein